MNYITYVASPIGIITLASDGDNLTGLWLGTQKDYTYNINDKIVNDELPIFQTVSNWLTRYFNKENPEINFPFLLTGREFRKSVWDLLLKIPYGTTISYGDLAKMLETESNKDFVSPRAIGQAIGANPILIIVPCHRVIQSDLALGGFAAGVGVKKYLLLHENPKSTFKMS